MVAAISLDGAGESGDMPEDEPVAGAIEVVGEGSTLAGTGVEIAGGPAG